MLPEHPLGRVGAGLLFFAVVVALYSPASRKEFVAVLSPEQRAVFASISRERLMIFLVALGAGGAGAALAVRSAIGRARGGHARALAAAGVGAIATYAVYTAWPKRHYMLEYLTDHSQTLAWTRLYRDMKAQFHAAFVLAVAGLGAVSWHGSAGEAPDAS